MALQRNDRTRRFSMAVSTVLFISSVGFLSDQSYARHAGHVQPEKFAVAAKDDPSQGGGATGDSAVSKDRYTIGPDDVLQINVWHEPDVSGTVSVRPDGRISLPLIGDLVASGLTPLKLQETLTNKFKAYLSNPEIDVTVKQVKSKVFNVLGEVQHPGSFALNRPVTVLDAIGLAGGFRDFAKVTRIYVLRRTPNGENIRLPFNYKVVIKGLESDENVELQPEDTVVVP
jgi:polysaccharide biosynthesis/export protein